jgi:hypothetical protein
MPSQFILRGFFIAFLGGNMGGIYFFANKKGSNQIG